jgi:hypothetical protein
MLDPTAYATCFRHAAQRAEITCSRCGTFCCSACFEVVGDLRYCAVCFERQIIALPSLFPRRFWARLGLRAIALAYASELLLTFAIMRAGPRWSSSETRLVVENALFLLLFIAAIVAFCRWFHLAVVTAASRGRELGSPAFCVGAWFIPGMNLFHPFATTRRMLPPGDPTTRSLVFVWQATWLVGVLGLIPETSLGMAVMSTGRAGTASAWLTLSLFVVQGRRVVMLFCALIAAAVVDRVTRGFALSQA